VSCGAVCSCTKHSPVSDAGGRRTVQKLAHPVFFLLSQYRTTRPCAEPADSSQHPHVMFV